MLSGLGRYQVTASRGRVNRPSFQTRANFGGSMSGPSGGVPMGTSSRTFGKNTQGDLLQMLMGGTEVEVRFMCRDMYMHDPVAGSVIDLVSHLPFGPYTLSGIPDKDALKIFQSCCEKLRVDSLFKALSVDYHVTGAFLGVLNFDQTRRIFDAVLPQNLDQAEITPVPVFGHTPLIDLRPSREIEALMKFQGDPRAEKFLKSLPEVLQNAGKTGKMHLNPENTLYVPRITFASQFVGVSVFRRMLPLYLLEKALMRGTIELAHRRQRGILHLMMGDDMWLPTNEELKEGADMFQVADSDPVGAIIATRPGMQVQEVQQGGEFWRWTDVMEALNAQKFRALGISEGFLNGEANVEGVETGMSVFVQQTRALRDYITRTALYEKVFPYLAVTNEVRKGEDRVYGRGDQPGMICGSAEEGYRVLCDGQTSILEDHNLDISDYHIPAVTWHNQLRPEGNAAYMEMLTRLQQLGLPIPMRMLAAAGGVSLQDILYGVDEDLEVRKEVSKYADKVTAMMPEALQPQEEASLREHLTSAVRAARGNKPRGLGARDFGELQERESPNVVNGHRYVSTASGRRARQERADRVAAEAAARLQERLRHEGDKPSRSTAKHSPF